MRSFIEAEQTYSGSAKGVTISRDRAILEMRNHSIPTAAFEEGLAESWIARPGQIPTDTDARFSASALLEWLGY